MTKINRGFTDIDSQLAVYKDGSDGYVPRATDRRRQRQDERRPAQLSENVSQVGGTLGLK